MASRTTPMGKVTLTPGDPRYCWNPYHHLPHEFHYELPSGLTGSYPCDGLGPAYRGPRPEDYKRLRAAGFFSWGSDAWIHEDDEGTVMSTADALERLS